MLNNVSHIIFDWDGTLMDSALKIVQCMQEAARRAGLPIPNAPDVEHIIGISLVPAIRQLFEIDEKSASVVSQHYKDIFLEKDHISCPLFDGVEQTLTHLSQHFTLGVATGKARRGLQRAFNSTRTEHYFSDSICADEAESKPSPDMLLQLLNRWGIKAHQAVMIGDTSYDMQMAQDINMPRIAVSYGVHDVEKLKQHEPEHTINSIGELKSLLVNVNENTNDR